MRRGSRPQRLPRPLNWRLRRSETLLGNSLSCSPRSIRSSRCAVYTEGSGYRLRESHSCWWCISWRSSRHSPPLCYRSCSIGCLPTSMRVSVLLAVALFSVTAASAQTPTIREESKTYGRPGWVMENGKIRVGLLRGGGHIAEVRMISTNPRLSINPMFVPAPRPDSGQAGDGYVGHLVCFP